MKKIILILLLSLGINQFFTSSTYASSDAGYFVVTAYYSPLPDQEHYSYSVYNNRERTFKEEKRLQGEGIAGASGKKVFSGMLAAPKDYKFGTKIYLEGLGIGEVADRGGAIVNKGVRGYSYDRIDVWMGYGDEGLRRATYWGKRTIKGSFVNKNSLVNLDYKIIPSPDGVIKTKSNKVKIKKVEEIKVFDKKLTTYNEYKKLQELLIEMNLYSGKIDGKYNSIIGAVYNFQLSKGIVKGEYSPGAGSYGPQTRNALKNYYEAFLVRKEEERLELVKREEEKKKEAQKQKELAEKFKKLEELSLIKAEKKLNLIGTPKYGEISHGVRELQITLNKLGYFDNKDTAIYGKITKQSIISYQLDKKIIISKDELGAGIVGPKTKKALKSDLKVQFLKEIVELEKVNNNELTLIIKEKV